MGVCMSNDRHVDRVHTARSPTVSLPEKRPLEQIHDPVKPFTFENLEIPPPEKLAICCMTHVSGLQCDRLGLFDFDKESPTYMQMVGSCFLGRGDEPGRINWTRSAASRSSVGMKKALRSHIVVPCMNTSRIYIVSIDGTNLQVAKIIKAHYLLQKDVSCPYSVRTLPIKGAPVHISTLGDRDGYAKGDFVLLDRHTFNLRNKIPRDTFSGFGGDFALQTRRNILITTEWSAPRIFRRGLSNSDLENVSENFGNCLHVFKISPNELLQTIELDGFDGCLTTTVRFVHNPEINHAFVCSAIGSSIFHIYMDSLSGKWIADKVAKVQPIQVKKFECGEIPAMLTDLVISYDDRSLFTCGYLHGAIWRFDITDPFRVSTLSVISLGGLLTTESEIVPATPFPGVNRFEFNDPIVISGINYRGGPALIQLSLDGKRLFVSNGIYKAWDAQFYPELFIEGGQIVKIDVTDKGMVLDQNFLIDMKNIEDGPYLPRDIHFMEGDCTSDNFL